MILPLRLPHARFEAFVALLCLSASASLSRAAPVEFDIPAQPASSALQAFGQQASVQVVYSAAELKKVQSTEVKGEMEPLAAIRQLLANTGYEAKQLTPTSFAVAKTDKPNTGSVEGSLALPGGSPAVDVLVMVRETGQSVITDRNGAYSFSSVPAGTYILVVTADGYQTLHITDVTIKANQLTTLASQTLRKPDDVTKMEPYDVNAQTIEQLEKYIVNDTSERPPAFTDRDVDIPRTIDDVQPYYIFNSQTIEQSGDTNVEDFLKNYLTMDTQSTSYIQNFGGPGQINGGSSINLRGLGTNETLILVDGRRMADISSQGNDYQPDINGIPLDAIDHIDVLPSSASAIYGGSAMGGVVNIVLKKDYNGGELKFTYDNPWNAYAPIRNMEATYGFSLEGGKTHVMITGQYSDSVPLLIENRLGLVERGIDDIFRNEGFSYATTNRNGYFSYGNFFSASTNISSEDSNADGNPSNLVLLNGTSLNSSITSVPVGTSPSTPLATLEAKLVANAGTYSTHLAPGTGQYALQNPLGYSPRTKSLLATIRREMTKNLDIFADFSTESTHSLQLVNFESSVGYYVPAGSPANPFQQDIEITIPSVLNLPMTNDSITHTFTSGFILKLPFEWRLESDYTWSQNIYSWFQYQFDGNNLDNGVATGALNILVDQNQYPTNFNPQGVYLGPYIYPNANNGDSTLNDLAARASGPLLHLPWGSPILTVGVEHRKEGTGNNYDYTTEPYYAPDGSGSDLYETLGQAESTESAYAEMDLPVVTPKSAIPYLQLLDLQFAGRTEDYSVGSGTQVYSVAFDQPPGPYNPYISPKSPTGGFFHSTDKYSSTNPTAGLKAQLLGGLTLRASYATAFLPPTYSQLTPNPVPNANPTRITDPQTGESYNVTVVDSGGGSTSLKPQKTKSWDAGAIWEPEGKSLKGLRVDLEFYHITELDIIEEAPGGAQYFVDNESSYPGFIVRDPTSGLITQVSDPLINLFKYETDGWDLSLGYRKNTSFGTFDLYAIGSIVEHLKQEVSLDSPDLEYVGFPSEGGPAKVKANATLTWQYHNWTLGWAIRYFDSYLQQGAPTDPSVIEYGPNTYLTMAQGSDHIPSQVYNDVFVSYVFGRAGGGRWRNRVLANWTLQVGVKDVFNHVPPFDAYYEPYFYSPYGDPRLRDLWISIKKDF